MVFPFSAIVGQDEMKLAILIAAVDPSVGGVLVFGDRGTGKSTAVRALAALLPPMRAVVGCRYHCDPAWRTACDECEARKAVGGRKSQLVPVPVVDLPLGATEDRVVGGREGRIGGPAEAPREGGEPGAVDQAAKSSQGRGELRAQTLSL